MEVVTGGSGAYTVDLRIRLDYYDTDALAWRPLVWHNLREWHARTLHVMLVAADLSGVYHWHAARDATYPSDDVFSVAGAALVGTSTMNSISRSSAFFITPRLHSPLIV